MNRTQSIITGGVVALALGSGFWMLARRGSAEETQYRTAVAAVRDLQQTVSATSVIQPFTVVDIKSRAGGEILTLAVDVGDRVRKGQLIARIDPTDSQTAFDQASADVASAKARITQAEQTRTLQSQTAVISIAQAEAQVRSSEAQVRAAQARLLQAKDQSDAQPILTNVAIEQAKADLETAEKQYIQLTKGTDPQTRQEAKTNLESAQASLQTAEANLKNAKLNWERQKQLLKKGFVAQSVVDTAEAQVTASQSQVDSAKAQVKAAATRAETVGVGQEAAIAVAQARVNQAKQALKSAEANRVQISLRQQDVKNAEAALAQARASLAQATANLDAARANRLQVDIRANDVETAKASIARAEAQLRNTTIVLNQTTIRAPSDGVVLQKYVEQGTIIASATGFSSGGGQSIVQIGDLSRVYVDAQVDETDISQVRVGQTVKIEFDAVPDQPFEGVVQRIEPRGVTDNNITTVKARIELKSPTPALRPGLNGECEFLIAEKKNVLVIPSRAVRNDKGKKFVQILVGDEKNPKVETREVKIGMETMEAVEVLSGVKEGEKIVTAIITPSKDGKDDKGGRGGGQGRESSAPGGLVGRR
jgi:HlyD family secretion protein